MRPGVSKRTAAGAAAGLAAAILAAAPPARAEEPPKRPASQDVAGDPLPAGAVARFGWARLHHGTRIKCLTFSPDGRVLASCGGQYNQPGDVSLWLVASGRLVHSLPGPSHGMGAVAFSPDGKTLAAAGMDRSVRFWDVASGKIARRFSVGSVRGNWVVFSPDGRTVAISDGSNVHVIDAARGRSLHTAIKASYCAFSPDGKQLATTSIRDPKQAAQLRDAASGKVIRQLKSEGQRFTAPAFSPDGQLLAAGCIYGTDRGTVMLWDTASGKLVEKLAGHGSYVIWVSFSPDGRLLASASRVDSIRIWDLEKSKALRDLPVAGEQIYATAFSPDGELLAAGGLSGQVRLWETATWSERYSERGHRGSIVSVAASADAGRVFTGGRDGTARLWEGPSGRQLHRLTADDAGVSAVAVSPDGRTLAACGTGQTVRIWDAATGKLRHLVRTGSHASLWIAFLPDGAKLIAFGPNGAASEIDAATGKVRLLHAGGDSSFTRVALSADGRLAVSFDRSQAYARQLRTGRRSGVFGIPGTGYFYGIALDPTGRLLACDAGQRVVLIELDSGKVVRQIVTARRRAGQGAIAFSPDGRALAATEMDGRIALWSVRTGKNLAERNGHRGPVTALAFPSGGGRLLSGSSDGTAILWSLAGTDPPGPPAGTDVDANDLDRLWADLASTDATDAQEAIYRLIDAGGRAAAFLGRRIESVVGPPPAEMGKLVADLGHPRFAVRRRATGRLAQLGALAEPALRRALDGCDSEEARARARQLLEALDDPHRRSGGIVRQLRGVYVLERIASDEARGVLRRLSSGSPQANLTRRAAAALERLKRSRR